MASPLGRCGALAGEIHVSSADRTRQTLEVIDAALPRLGLVERVHVDDALYTFRGDALREWLKALPADAARVLVIGHNPALIELARWLCPELPASFPTGSLVHLRLPDGAWRSVTPRSAEWVASLSPAEVSYDIFQPEAPATKEPGGIHLPERAALQLEHQYQLIRELEPGVIAGFDPEFLHQYRVNLRRSRAIGESVLAAVKVPGLRKGLKRLKRRAQATSDLRDLDVFLASLSQQRPLLAPRVQPALQAWLSSRRDVEHQALCEQLASEAYAREKLVWGRFLASGSFRKALRKLTRKRVQTVLTEQVAQHDRSLASITVASPDEALHDLRKGVKRIRYLAELDPERHRDLLSSLRQRQNLLGNFQDLCTWQAWVGEFAAELDGDSDQRAGLNGWLAELGQQKQALRERLMGERQLHSSNA
ncbi:phosphohistidine phosphatase [Natronocella acetinitrilica]|uniref:Phosphohistidine phosphatase n=1 Tax=Natronocella acetinitrilica TaxID=414046 RepID=A0AAE3G9E0_9GAMM|nr:CHAD domain-containing protein [Natronocella acetinitrilica]MCP1676212.1 phosphohistidine phosphatase [Natronocella acetinitrilica]